MKGQESFVDAYSCFFDNLKQVFKFLFLLKKNRPFVNYQKSPPSFFYAFDILSHLYSSQNESILNEELQKEDITDLFLCGLATDVCVGKNLQHHLHHHWTSFSPSFLNSTQPSFFSQSIAQQGWSAFHALESGYRTVIVEDASRGIFSQVSPAVVFKIVSCILFIFSSAIPHLAL